MRISTQLISLKAQQSTVLQRHKTERLTSIYIAKKNAQAHIELGHFITKKFTYFITTCCVYETPFVETVTKYVPGATSFTGTAID